MDIFICLKLQIVYWIQGETKTVECVTEDANGRYVSLSMTGTYSKLKICLFVYDKYLFKMGDMSFCLWHVVIQNGRYVSLSISGTFLKCMGDMSLCPYQVLV